MSDQTKRPLVLLADDDADYLFQIRFALQCAGFDVITADSMAEADLLLDQSAPDLAIFDLMMERDDAGFVLSYHAKKRHPNMPVILLTGVTSETGRVFGQDNQGMGAWVKADLYLDKGIHPDQILVHVKSLLAG
jgi:DNA-binding response OmpR family regulator